MHVDDGRDNKRRLSIVYDHIYEILIFLYFLYHIVLFYSNSSIIRVI